jgi:hypothetical protein
MYQELEMYKKYKKEKAAKIQHNHEVIASVSALTFFGTLAIIVFCLV